MNILYRKYGLLFYIGLFFVVTAISSCEKVPGKVILNPKKTESEGTTGNTGSTGGTGGSGTIPNTNGIGDVAVGAANTIIFKVNNGTTYTLSTPANMMTAGFWSSGPVTGGPYSQIGCINLTTLDQVEISYSSLTTGLYSPFLISISTTALDLTSFGGTEKINVTTQNVVGNISGVTGSQKGTVTGTFDGYMIDNNNSFKQVRVAGSFNISL